MSTDRRQFLGSAVGGIVAAGAGSGATRAWAQGAGSRIKPGGRDVLLVVDVQNDFIPGGALPVKEGDLIVPLVNQVAAGFEHVILTQDWHTPGHISFASTHPGKKPFETTTLPYGTQVLWPDHCVQGTLATDFCVCWSALDARKVGLGALVIEDACRGIDTNGSLAKAWAQMTKAGVKRIRSSDLAA